MFKTEISPLITANSKSTNSKCKLIRFLSILVLCVAGAFLVYYSSISESSATHSDNNLFLNENGKWYPAQKELDEHRSKTVFIEYDMKDAPETDDMIGDTMQKFHANLIKKHGYNSNDHNINFVVTDAVTTTTKNPLTCNTMYAISDEAGFMELNCNDYFSTNNRQFSITGCVSYEADSNIRRGERGFESSECCTYAVGVGVTVLSGRCCRANRRIGLQTSYTLHSAISADDHCTDVYCNVNGFDTSLGCGAAVVDETSALSGVKRIQNDNNGETGCKSQRSTIGGLFIAPYCGKTKSGALRCKTEQTKDPSELVRQGKWISRAQCEEDMTLTDCDSEIKAEINYCTDAEIAREGDKGVNYGAFISRKKCVALGDTDNIVAVATCCTVDNLND